MQTFCNFSKWSIFSFKSVICMFRMLLNLIEYEKFNLTEVVLKHTLRTLFLNNNKKIYIVSKSNVIIVIL
jgi:hypothetical protein